MKEPKTKIAKYIYWRNRANKYENLYNTEVLKNTPLKEELLETQNKLISLFEKKQDNDRAIKELKTRVSDLEQVKNKKKVK